MVMQLSNASAYSKSTIEQGLVGKMAKMYMDETKKPFQKDTDVKENVEFVAREEIKDEKPARAPIKVNEEKWDCYPPTMNADGAFEGFKCEKDLPHALYEGPSFPLQGRPKATTSTFSIISLVGTIILLIMVASV